MIFLCPSIHSPLVSVRLKAVKNIQKITKSMKMVAAAKYNKAERELKPAKTYGEGSMGGCGHNHECIDKSLRL